MTLRKQFKVGMMARVMMMEDQTRFRRGRITEIYQEDQMLIDVSGTPILGARVPHKNTFREQGAG